VTIDFDENKIAAEFIEANIEKALAIGADTFKGAKDKVRLQFQRTYKQYIKRLLARHSNAKSFFVLRTLSPNQG
jgi:hypothetical protein